MMYINRKGNYQPSKQSDDGVYCTSIDPEYQSVNGTSEKALHGSMWRSCGCMGASVMVWLT